MRTTVRQWPQVVHLLFVPNMNAQFFCPHQSTVGQRWSGGRSETRTMSDSQSHHVHHCAPPKHPELPYMLSFRVHLPSLPSVRCRPSKCQMLTVRQSELAHAPIYGQHSVSPHDGQLETDHLHPKCQKLTEVDRPTVRVGPAPTVNTPSVHMTDSLRRTVCSRGHFVTVTSMSQG